VRSGVSRSLISLEEKYGGRFYKNRERSGLERPWNFPAEEQEGKGSDWIARGESWSENVRKGERERARERREKGREASR